MQYTPNMACLLISLLIPMFDLIYIDECCRIPQISKLFSCSRPFDDWNPNLMMNGPFIDELLVDYDVICGGGCILMV